MFAAPGSVVVVRSVAVVEAELSAVVCARLLDWTSEPSLKWMHSRYLIQSYSILVDQIPGN